jgi:hypothetical protein
MWIITQIGLHNFGRIGNRPLLAYSVAATLLGAQALSLGLLAELLIANTGRDRDTYSIAECTGVPEEAASAVNETV